MNHMTNTILLGFVNFIYLIFMICYHLIIGTAYEEIRGVTSLFGVETQVNPLLTNLETAGWMFFILLMIGSVAYYIYSSRRLEYEEYERYNPNRYYYIDAHINPYGNIGSSLEQGNTH